MIPEPVLIALAFLSVGVVQLACWVLGCELVKAVRRVRR